MLNLMADTVGRQRASILHSVPGGFVQIEASLVFEV